MIQSSKLCRIRLGGGPLSHLSISTSSITCNHFCFILLQFLFAKVSKHPREHMHIYECKHRVMNSHIHVHKCTQICISLPFLQKSYVIYMPFYFLFSFLLNKSQLSLHSQYQKLSLSLPVHTSLSCRCLWFIQSGFMMDSSFPSLQQTKLLQWLCASMSCSYHQIGGAASRVWSKSRFAYQLGENWISVRFYFQSSINLRFSYYEQG